jgi:inner membrane protein
VDSLTQATLGAAIGAAFLGSKIGRKSAVLGAIIGTVPDLDVFVPMGDPVSDFTYHRGATHSYIFCLFMTPILVWLASKIKWFNLNFKDFKTHLAFFAIIVTHILLDAMTIYGTQLFWPLSVPPVGVGSIFIIDPLYTLPFLGFVIAYLFLKSRRLIHIGLAISTLYLAWSVGAQAYVRSIVVGNPQMTDSAKILVQPTPFNTILWRVVIMEDESYRIGYYSLFDDTKQIDYKVYPLDKTLLSGLENTFAVQRLQWFTKGFYDVVQIENDIIIRDLRMGLEPENYVFQFIINREPNAQYYSPRNMRRLGDVWDRMIRDL